MEKILPNLYRIEIPLPNNPLGSLNSYVIDGENRTLIIDTGMNLEKCRKKIVEELEGLNIDLNNSDFFVTHLHADHLGLVGVLATKNSKIYFNEIESSYLSADDEEISGAFQEMLSFYKRNGFPQEEIERILKRHPGSQYSPGEKLDFISMSGGDELEVGDYSFKCVETPGHSPGHLCLYETEKKILISGDHILFDITPNITWWPVMDDLKSLEKVSELDVDLVLPGHRSIQSDHRQRIEELREHHENRLNEILSVFEEDEEKTAWDIAPKITWDINFDSWEELPTAHKWFATGEAIAHLVYLEGRGKIRRKTSDGKIFYSKI